MYLYTDFDQQLVNERVAQFRDQTERYLAGKLTEDEYRPLRLQNGLYAQRYLQSSGRSSADICAVWLNELKTIT